MAKYPTVVALSCRLEEKQMALDEAHQWMNYGYPHVRKVVLLSWSQDTGDDGEAGVSCSLEVFEKPIDGSDGAHCVQRIVS